jgi:uncharacterized protein involved in outer membrane biogenesis
MIKRIVKYSLGVLAVLLVLLLAAPFFIDVNDYRPQIAQAVEKATGREISIGEMHASLFPWVGVSLDNVELANRKGFSDVPFVKVKNLEVQVALLPLFSREVEIKQFRLDGPQIFLERNIKGEGNWEDLGRKPADTAAAPQSAPAQEEGSSSLAALSAEALQLVDGKLVWMDAASGKRLELKHIQIDVSHVQLNQPVHATASAQIDGGAIDVDALIGPIGDLGKLDVAHLPLQLKVSTGEPVGLQPFAAWLPELPAPFGDMKNAHLDLNMQLEQRPDGLRLSVGHTALHAGVRADLDWKVEMPDARQLRVQQLQVKLEQAAVLQAQGDVRNLDATPRYTMRIQSEPLARTWLEQFVPELKGMYAGHAAPWKQVKLGAMLAGDPERVEIRDMQLLLDGELVQLSGTIAYARAPDIRLRLAANTLHLDPWLPQPASQKDGGGAPAAAAPAASEKAVEPDLRFLKSWRVNAQMQIEQMHLRGLQLDHLRATAKGERGLFTLDPLRFELSGGQVSEKASLDASRYPATWTESIHASRIRLGPVLKALADMDLIEGTMQLETDLKATGLLPDTAKKSLNGRGQVSLTDGRVKGFDIAGTLRNLAAPGKQGGPQYTDFAQLQGSFVIRNGIAKNSDLFMASPLFRLTGEGTVDLPKSSLDYHVKPRLVGTLVGQGDTLTVRKGLTVPLHIFGPFASPRVQPQIDARELISDVIQKRLGGQQAAPADQQQTAPAKQPQQQLQKAIEGLFGR